MNHERRVATPSPIPDRMRLRMLAAMSRSVLLHNFLSAHPLPSKVPTVPWGVSTTIWNAECARLAKAMATEDPVASEFMERLADGAAA